MEVGCCKLVGKEGEGICDYYVVSLKERAVFVTAGYAAGPCFEHSQFVS